MTLMAGRRDLLKAMAAGVVAAATAEGPLSARSPEAGHAAVQALIDGYVAGGKVPGAIVGLLAPGRFRPRRLTAGRTLFEGGRPVSPDTLWRIYSMTKPITGIAVMQMVADGRITLDTPIADIMPEFRAMRVLTDPETSLESRPATRPIRVRHLLTHTAGFGYTINGDGPLEREYRRLGLLPMSSRLLMQAGDAEAPDLRSYMERLATLPLRTEPGAAWRYSVALDVAGAMLERLTGESLDRLLERQIFRPLGMADTVFALRPAQMERLAGLYAWRDPRTMKPLERPVLIDGPEKSEWAAQPRMLAGGAGLISSAENYARFAQMLLNEGMFEGRRLLAPGHARMAMTNQTEAGVLSAAGEGHASGGRVTLFDPEPGKTGDPAGLWGWGGAAGTLFHVDRVRGCAVVLMLQSFGDDDGPSPEALRRALGGTG